MRESTSRMDIEVTHLRRSMTLGKRQLLFLWAAVLAAACGAGRDALDTTEQVEIPSAHAVTVHVVMNGEHAAQSGRYSSAARTTLKAYADRFGVMPFAVLNLVDPGWPGTPAPSSDAATVAAPTRFLALGSTMGPEISVTRAIGAAFWRRVLSCGGGDGVWLDGLARFTSTPVVASQFFIQQMPPAYAFAERRYFDGLVPLAIRVPLRNATMGNGLDDYLAAPRVDVRRVRNDTERRAAV